MVVSQCRDAAASGSTGQEAQLHEIGFIYIFQGYGFFANGGSLRFQTHGAAAIVLNDGGEHPAVDVVQSQPVYLQPGQG